MPDKFSRLELEAARKEEELNRIAELQPAAAFPEHLLTEKWKKYRKTNSKNFSFFNKTYFPPEVHKSGYSEPGRLQKAIPDISQMPGFHVVLGPRAYAKTVTSLISVIWLFLRGKISFLGTYSETLDKARGLMYAIGSIIKDNPRIRADYSIKVECDNNNEFRFRIAGLKTACVIKPYSLDRSVRGAVQLFDRVDFLLGDDIETMTSSLEPEIVDTRIRILEEAYKSLTDKGTFLILGNNFDEECAVNKLLLRQDKGDLPPGHYIHIFPAWSDSQGALWHQRYPANSEEELQTLHEADEEQWSGDYQQRPERKGGYIFPKEHWQEYDELPPDALGIAYCDPNCAIDTEKSDTTAMGALLYSPSTNCFYAYRIFCQAFSNAIELLDKYYKIFDAERVALMAFDGNVNQEAVWSNFVLNWAFKNKRPFPPIDYRKYDVDLHLKTVQAVFSEDRILFPRGTRETPDGERFYKQIIKFKGKKNRRKKQKVDAPDWLVCAFEVLHDPQVRMGEFYPREFKITTFPEFFNY